MTVVEDVPPSFVHYFNKQGMSFKGTYNLHVSRVEKWIRKEKEKFLDATPIKCVGLDFEFTDTKKKLKQGDLPLDQRQRAAILQLSMVYETLVFQIVHVDAVLEAQWEFLRDDCILFFGAAIGNAITRMEYYGINILGAIDLQ